MTAWNPEDLARIADSEELIVATTGADGGLREPVPVWVVRDGDELYVRSYKGAGGAWFRAATARPEGRVSAGGIEMEVSFDEAAGDGALNDRIDDAYRSKYRRYGADYIDPMIADQARATTLRLIPQ
jgi:hypothetical protein